MCDQIVSRAMIFDRGAAAYAKGLGIDAHGMNPGAPAIPDWQAGWLDAKQRWNRAMRRQAEVVTKEAA